MKKQIILYVFVFSLVMMIHHAMAADDKLLQIERYSTVNQAASAAQVNPLQAAVQITFPQRVATIEDAVNYALQYSGYTLAPAFDRSKELNTVLAKPLPLVDRRFNYIALQDALLVLVGKNHFILTQDDINRSINFKIKDAKSINTNHKAIR